MEEVDGEMVEEILMDAPPNEEQPTPVEADSSNLQVIGQEMVFASGSASADVPSENPGTKGTKGGRALISSMAASPERKPLEIVPYTPPSKSKGLDDDSTASEGALARGGRKLEPFRSVPGSLEPNTRFNSPLFSPEQIATLEESYERNPLVYGDPARLKRPGWLPSEESLKEAETRGGKTKEPTKVRSPAEDEVSWRMQTERHLKELGLSLRASQAENERLRLEMQLMREFGSSTSRFSTPASMKEDGTDVRQDLQDGPRGQQAGEENSKGKPVKKEKIEGRGAVLGGGKGKGDGLDVGSSSSKSEANQDKTMHLVLRLMENMQNLQKSRSRS